MENLSVKKHDEIYINKYNDMNYWTEHNNRHKNDSVFNNREIKLRHLLENNTEIRGVAIDIGSGAGWLSSKLTEYFKKVISIEPSRSAVEICKNLYKDKNIEWINEFPRSALPRLDFNEPVLVVTCSVFQHLENEEIEDVLNWINFVPMKNSILGLQELWGIDSHQPMQHIRTKDWWTSKLSNWELDFHGPEVMTNTSKGIHGKKGK